MPDQDPRVTRTPTTEAELRAVTNGTLRGQNGPIHLADYDPEPRRRTDPVRAGERELASNTWRYVQHYADAKPDVVEAIIARALSGGTA